ncbi:GNAT family N-acetyltransferase [Patescibacteria group bacterium]|nr:GNAT family N-acetyltransferase [Patescibacteria group bacterium]
MGIVISKATKKELGKFGERAWREADLELYGKPIRWVEKPFLFKATKDGTIVGKIDGRFGGGVLFIDNLIVAKGARRQGVGTLLVTEAEKFGKSLGAHKVYLFTGEAWGARQLYEQLGYKEAGKLPLHYFKRDFVIYAKML